MKLSSSADSRGGTSALGVARAEPYRFSGEPLDIEACGRVLPAARFADTAAMLASSQPKAIGWRLES